MKKIEKTIKIAYLQGHFIDFGQSQKSGCRLHALDKKEAGSGKIRYVQSRSDRQSLFSKEGR